MMKSKASHTVFVGMLAIAFFELGITKRFGQIWNLAFQPTPKAPAQPTSNPPAVQVGPPPGDPTNNSGTVPVGPGIL